MKRTRVFLSAFALATLCFVPAALAQNASGDFKGDTPLGTNTIAFNADIFSSGRASGDIKFNGPMDIPNQDVDGDGGGDVIKETSATLYAAVDCGRVDGNRAVMSGIVKDSDIRSFIGRRIILAVEDGGEKPDGYTWGQYFPNGANWLPADAELKEDPGTGTSWLATDAEVRDDKGIMETVEPEPVAIDCQSFLASSYALDSIVRGSGDIVIR